MRIPVMRIPVIKGLILCDAVCVAVRVVVCVPLRVVVGVAVCVAVHPCH